VGGLGEIVARSWIAEPNAGPVCGRGDEITCLGGDVS
jgi:hypothetical protein